MTGLIIIIVIVVAIYYYKKKCTLKKNANGEYDVYVSRLIRYYSILRDNYGSLGTDERIVIGSNIFEYGEGSGSLAGAIGDGGFLSVRIGNVDNDFLAENLHAKIDIIKGKKYYQFIEKKDSGKGFSKQEKVLILNSVIEKLNATYGQGTACMTKGTLCVIC